MVLALDAMPMVTFYEQVFSYGGVDLYQRDQNGLKRFYQVFPVFLPHLTNIASHFLVKLVYCLPCVLPLPYNQFLALTYATCLL